MKSDYCLQDIHFSIKRGGIKDVPFNQEPKESSVPTVVADEMDLTSNNNDESLRRSLSIDRGPPYQE
jgi:hypothetical protein